MEAKQVDIEKYREGMRLLAESGIVTFLRQFGAVEDMGIHAEMVNANFSEARRSYGFNQALNYLVKFQENFLAPDKEDVPMPHDYGALNQMLKTKQITKEQYDVLSRKPIFNPRR